MSPYGYLSFTPTAPGKARQHKIELDRTTNSVWKNPDPHPPPPPLPPSQEFREGQRFTGTVTKDSLADRTGGGRGTTLKEFVAKGQTKGGALGTQVSRATVWGFLSWRTGEDECDHDNQHSPSAFGHGGEKAHPSFQWFGTKRTPCLPHTPNTARGGRTAT